MQLIKITNKEGCNKTSMWGTRRILRVWWAPMHQQTENLRTWLQGSCPSAPWEPFFQTPATMPSILMQLRQGILYCWIKESSSLCMSLRKKMSWYCMKTKLAVGIMQGPRTAMTLMFNRSTHQTHDSLLGAPPTLAKLWVMDCNWRLFSARSLLKGPCRASRIRTAVLPTVLWWCVFTLIGHTSSCGWLGRWFFAVWFWWIERRLGYFTSLRLTWDA